jgi:hypothetical protein
MSPSTIFSIQLILGYVPWLLFLGAYGWPRLKAMDTVQAQRAIATLHSFRFFGLAFILPGVVGPDLPAGFAPSAAYGDFATGMLAMLALATVRIRPLFWLFVAFNVVGTADLRQLLSRRPVRASRTGGRAGGDLLDPHPLRARTDDHACRGVLSAGASSGQDVANACRKRGFPCAFPASTRLPGR